MSGQDLEVRVKRLDPLFAEWRVDKRAAEDSRKIFEKMNFYHISYLIRLQESEINVAFPDELPPSLQFHPKIVENYEKPRKQGTNYLEVEAKTVIGEVPIDNKRKSRYSGNYSLDEAFKKAIKVEKTEPAKKERRRVNSSSSVETTASLSLTTNSMMKMVFKRIPPKPSGSFNKIDSAILISSDSSDTDSSEPIQTKSAEKAHDEKLKMLYHPVLETPPPKAVPAPTVGQGRLKAPVKRSLAEARNLSSSSSSEDDSSAKEIVAPPKPKPVPEHVMKPSTSKVNNPAVVKMKPPLKKPRIVVETMKKPQPKPEPPKAAAKEFIRPPIIAPPKMNPRTFKPVVNTMKQTQKPKKMPDAAKGIAALGGIFSIDNGWDKHEQEKKKVGNSFTIPKVPSKSAAVVPPLQNQLEDEIEEAHNVYFNSDMIGFQEDDTSAKEIVAPPKVRFIAAGEKLIEAPKDKFNRLSREESEDDEDDDMLLLLTDKDKSIFSDSDSEAEPVKMGEIEQTETFQAESDLCEKVKEGDTAVKIVEQSKTLNSGDQDSSSEDEAVNPSKRPRMSTPSDDENDATDIIQNKAESPAQDDADEEGIFEINADPDELDDESDEEYVPLTKPKAKPAAKREPPAPEVLYTTELDDTKMTIRKEVFVDTSGLTAAAEFDKNTDEILMNMPARKFDDATERVFKKFFPGSCLEAYEEHCDGNCALNHNPPEINAVRPLFTAATLKEVDEAYGVCIKYQKLFEAYGGLFAEMFIKKTPSDETKIARMIMDCEKTPKTHEIYRSIVQSLVIYKELPRYKAVRIIINHHTDSPIAQELIISLILETGPDIIRFMDYLNQLHSKRSIPVPTLDKILEKCVCFQNPLLPGFLLDNLIGLKPAQLQQINKDNLAKFIRLQVILIEGGEERISKSAVLVQKTASLQQARSAFSGI